MLTVSNKQMQSLGEDFSIRTRAQCQAFILSCLREHASETMKSFTPEQQEHGVSRVLEAGERIGLTKLDHLLNWSYIRFLSGLEFFAMGEFKDILNHPLLHPDAKGRHIVLAFFAIQRMTNGSLT